MGCIEICDYRTCQKCVSLPTERKEMNVSLTICLKEISLFGNWGYYVLTIFSNTCMNFMGWRRGLGLIFKSLVTSALHALAMLSHSRSLSKCSLILQLPHEWVAKQLCQLFVWKKNVIFFLIAEPPCGRLLMLGREGLQLHYLIKFVSKCNWSCKSKLLNCLWFWRVLIQSFERRESPFILSNWGACVKNLVG